MAKKTVTLEIDGSSGDPEIELAIAEAMAEYFALFKKKQHDYGPRNISQFGEAGVVMRCHDKIQRLIRLQNQTTAVPGETLRDTWTDIAGYGLIGILCFDGNWPEVEANPAAKDIT